MQTWFLISDIIFKKKCHRKEDGKIPVIRRRRKEARTVQKGEAERGIEKQASGQTGVSSEGPTQVRVLGKTWWSSVQV